MDPLWSDDGLDDPIKWTARELLWLMSFPHIGSKRALSVATLIPDPADFADRWPEHVQRLAAWASEIPAATPEPAAKNQGVEVVGRFDDTYPSALRQISDPPLVLWVRGNLRPAARSIAVVGTRHPTDLGQNTARVAADEAAESGLGVVSGLALGCDAIAHRAALDADGYTIAVLGGALFEPQPKRNQELANRILESGGALVTEVPPHVRPEPRTLVQRNRIQAGLSRAVVIAQTGIPGGTLHTARFALEQGSPLIVPRPSSSEARLPESAGNMALTDPAGCDPEVLKAVGQLAEQLKQRAPIADAAPTTPSELRAVIRELA